MALSGVIAQVYGYVYNHDQERTVQGDMTWKLATREVPVEVLLVFCFHLLIPSLYQTIHGPLLF